MPWYKSGTVSCTLNSTTVTGTSTAFAANCRVGDAFLGPDGRWYEVVNVASDTVLSISPAYIGATVSAGTYALAPMQGYVKDSADALRTLVNKFGTLAAAASINALAAIAGVAGKFPYFVDAQNMDLATLTDYAKSGQNSDIKALTGLTTALAVSMGGTGVTSMAALLSALIGAGAYAKSNIVGTTSQTSGVPTGAVIERGSNSNGIYTKFADGTLMSWVTMPMTWAAGSSGSGIWTFPAAFIDTTNTRLFANIATSSPHAFNAVGVLNSATTGTIWTGGTTAGSSFPVYCFAIGRWF